jgi:hypothetical protein
MAKMAHVGFVLIMFIGKIPLMSSYNVEKGKGCQVGIFCSNAQFQTN